MTAERKTERGKVIEALPNLEFIVEFDHGARLRCYTGGRLKLHHIRILIGDKVEVVNAGNIGRIVRRS